MGKVNRWWVGAAAVLVAGTAWAGLDVVFQRKLPDGVVVLTNVPAEDGFSPVAGGVLNQPAAPRAPGAVLAPGGVPLQPAATAPVVPQQSEDAKTAEAFAKQLDQTAPVREGNANTMRDRMESLYEASRAAREAKARAAGR